MGRRDDLRFYQCSSGLLPVEGVSHAESRFQRPSSPLITSPPHPTASIGHTPTWPSFLLSLYRFEPAVFIAHVTVILAVTIPYCQLVPSGRFRRQENRETGAHTPSTNPSEFCLQPADRRPPNSTAITAQRRRPRVRMSYRRVKDCYRATSNAVPPSPTLLGPKQPLTSRLLAPPPRVSERHRGRCHSLCSIGRVCGGARQGVSFSMLPELRAN